MHSMSYAEGPGDYEKEMKKKREAMKTRFEKLDKGNPVVKEALTKINQQMRKPDRDQWSAVDELVGSAYGQFCDGELGFEKAVKSLSDALAGLLKAKK